MTTTIRFRITKDIDTATERKIRKLNGSLIAQSYTDVVHFDDDGEKFYINYFTTDTAKNEVHGFIASQIEEAGLATYVTIIE